MRAILSSSFHSTTVRRSPQLDCENIVAAVVSNSTAPELSATITS